MDDQILTQPDYRWEISVSAGSYFESMSDNFGGNDLGFRAEDESHTGKVFLAYSYHADECSDPDAAARRIFSLQVLLNGAIRVRDGNLASMPVKFWDFNDGARRYTVNPSSIEEFPFSTVPFIDRDLTGFRDPKRSDLSYMVFLAKSDDIIRSALMLAGLIATHDPLLKIHSWGALYKILDTIRYGCRTHGWGISDLGDEKEVDRFTAACNNASVLGIEARHGLSKKGKPPKSVMTDLDEASNLILGMTWSYVRKFVKLSRIGFETGVQTRS